MRRFQSISTSLAKFTNILIELKFIVFKMYMVSFNGIFLNTCIVVP